jgi:GxxExxY protein
VVDLQKPTPVIYEDVMIEVGYRADMIVEDKVIVELKSVEPVTRSQEAVANLPQTRRQRPGVLINFGSALIRNGITRVVNQLDE